MDRHRDLKEEDDEGVGTIHLATSPRAGRSVSQTRGEGDRQTDRQGRLEFEGGVAREPRANAYVVSRLKRRLGITVYGAWCFR